MLSAHAPPPTWQSWPAPPQPSTYSSHRQSRDRTSRVPRTSSNSWTYPSSRRSSTQSYKPLMTSPLSTTTSPDTHPTSSPLTPSTPIFTFSPSAADLASCAPSDSPARPNARAIPGPPSARKALSVDAQTQARRKLFLNKVRQGGENKRWESRAKDMEKLDRAEYEREMRRWEAERLAEAPFSVEEEEEGEEEVGADEVEDVARQEEMEMEELVGMMDFAEGDEVGEMEMHGVEGQNVERSKRFSDHFGSDDEEYEALFEEMLSRHEEDGDAMDLGS
ncbi:hypothetical protein C1H76_5619 [Elsinoe australis]|uniref:Uncharacterized protein n=1 Tax=Elsinoe australis TaxID=40998 RepID=A0A4U7B0F3_9PEZI|nr:hypothetical protein C1H76_5619 [Elsinoe australis]